MEPFLLLALGLINIMGQIHNYGIDLEKKPHLKNIRVRRQLDSEPYAYEDIEYTKSIRTTTEDTPEEQLLLHKRDTTVREERHDYKPYVPVRRPRIDPIPINLNGNHETNRYIRMNQPTSSLPNYFIPYVKNTKSATSQNYATINIKNDYTAYNGYDNNYAASIPFDTTLPKYRLFKSKTDLTKSITDKNVHNNVIQNNRFNTGITNNRHSVIDAPVRSMEVWEYHGNRKRRSFESDAYKQIKKQNAAAIDQINNKQHNTNYDINPYNRYSNGDTASSTQSIRYSTNNYNQYTENKNVYGGGNGYNGVNNDNVYNDIGNGYDGGDNRYYANNAGYGGGNNGYKGGTGNNGYYTNNNTINWNNTYNTPYNGISTYSPFKNPNSPNNTLNYQNNGYNTDSNNETNSFTNNNGFNTTNNETSYNVTSTTPTILQGVVIASHFGCPKFMRHITIMGKKICMPDDSGEDDW